MGDRINLTVKEVKEPRDFNGKKVLDFTAEKDGKNLRYSVWEPKLFAFINKDASIDAEVVSKESEKTDQDGNHYINRKVVNIYVDGKAVAEAPQRGGYFRPDNSASIESQTAIKEIGECWRVGKFKDDDILVTAYRVWLTGRVTPHKQAPVSPSKPLDTTSKPEATPAKDATHESSGKTDAPTFKTGVDLFNYALKHGWSLEKLNNALGTSNPKDIKDVEAARKVLGI